MGIRKFAVLRALEGGSVSCDLGLCRADPALWKPALLTANRWPGSLVFKAQVGLDF